MFCSFQHYLSIEKGYKKEGSIEICIRKDSTLELAPVYDEEDWEPLFTGSANEVC